MEQIKPINEKEIRTDTLSVIIPISERHDDVTEIFYDFRDAIRDEGMDPELVFVVDGDFEGAYQDLISLVEKGEKLTIVKHARTFGEATAITEGFKHTSGELVMILPSYFQVEASDIGSLISGLGSFDMVVVRRWPRNDSRFNQFQTRFFHLLTKVITGVKMNDIGCSVRLMRRNVLEEIDLYGDLHRFLPIMADRHGFKVHEIAIRQSYREQRVRTYPLGVYVRRLIDLLSVFFLVKFTKKPLRFFGLAGTAILVPGLLITVFLTMGRLFGNVSLSERPLFLLGILLIVLGIQVFAIGLVGEIIIFTHARELKEYTVEEIIN